MFREKDIQEMKDVSNFDLSKYEDVKARAPDIYRRVSDGSMPCDGAWSAQQIAKLGGGSTRAWTPEGQGDT